MYISPAPQGSPDADKWFIWLEGGAGCNDVTSCADRWCGVGGNNAGKMSSRWTPPSIRGSGIFRREPEGEINQFGGYNLVQIYYCSSDNWIGSIEHNKLDDPDDAYPAYSMHMKGARIVDAAIASLQVGAASDDGEVSLPSLNEATQLLFAGTSAGGGGARYNADRVHQIVKKENPEIDFRLIVDAGFHPKDTNEALGVTKELSDSTRAMQHDVFVHFRGGAAYLDTSCLDYHEGEEHFCSDNTHLLVHHIDVPWFVKMDLSDAANTPGIFRDEDPETDDAKQFTTAVYDLVVSLADLPSFREEGGAYVPGVFAPNCGHHVNLEVGSFYTIRISPQGSESALSTHDVLFNWVSGAGATVAIHQPDGSFRSSCP